VRAVAGDIGVDAVKIGMLGTPATIAAVARALTELRGTDGTDGPPVVLDPVMVSESGARLLDPAARDALIAQLLPRVTVVTPNLPEARVLAGADDDEEDAEALARAIHALGPGAVVVTGGHRRRCSDLFYDGEQFVELTGERHPDGATHGSGCTHSSVLAARLALGDEPLAAARFAKRLAAQAVRNGLRTIGKGAGPVDVLAVHAGPPGDGP
jgi:hydroxymethylpyrimidine/phosphomethylpyrimidine kinase